jgi:BirA family biotin operon repressor/biotin-[acetyl-CoA-carboxylase] ligase
MYDLAALEAALSNSIYAGKLHFAPVTGSTNVDAVAAGRAGAAHGSVFFADEQIAGRGRGDHTWESAAGQGLYVSILLRPAMRTEHLPLVPLAAGLAAADAVAFAAELAVDLRWPNDILIGHRKAGGILVESKSDGSSVSFVVIGIGINVHQRVFDSGLSTPATSLDVEAGRSVSREALLIALLESLQRESQGLHDPAMLTGIPARVAVASSWLWNRPVQVHGPQACVGITRGLDEHGFLLVRTEAGTVTVRTGGIRAAD